MLDCSFKRFFAFTSNFIVCIVRFGHIGQGEMEHLYAHLMLVIKVQPLPDLQKHTTCISTAG